MEINVEEKLEEVKKEFEVVNAKYIEAQNVVKICAEKLLELRGAYAKISEMLPKEEAKEGLEIDEPLPEEDETNEPDPAKEEEAK